MFSGVAWLAIYIAISTSLVGNNVPAKVKTKVTVPIAIFCIFERYLNNELSDTTPSNAMQKIRLLSVSTCDSAKIVHGLMIGSILVLSYNSKVTSKENISCYTNSCSFWVYSFTNVLDCSFYPFFFSKFYCVVAVTCIIFYYKYLGTY